MIVDVSPLLADDIVVNTTFELKPGLKFNQLNFDENESVINIPSNSCNETKEFINTSKFCNLKSLTIGMRCFRGASSFDVNNLSELKSIEVDSQSFTLSCGPVYSRSFNVSDCPKLESIILQPYTFTDYANSFTLSNLPSLQFLQIGEIGIYSTNFYKLSFCVKGIQS